MIHTKINNVTVLHSKESDEEYKDIRTKIENIKGLVVEDERMPQRKGEPSLEKLHGIDRLNGIFQATRIPKSDFFLSIYVYNDIVYIGFFNAKDRAIYDTISWDELQCIQDKDVAQLINKMEISLTSKSNIMILNNLENAWREYVYLHERASEIVTNISEFCICNKGKIDILLYDGKYDLDRVQKPIWCRFDPNDYGFEYYNGNGEKIECTAVIEYNVWMEKMVPTINRIGEYVQEQLENVYRHIHGLDINAPIPSDASIQISNPVYAKLTADCSVMDKREAEWSEQEKVFKEFGNSLLSDDIIDNYHILQHNFIAVMKNTEIKESIYIRVFPDDDKVIFVT